MTGVDADLATGVREALGALHRMSESAGEHGLYANEAALHHVYTAIDESWAAVEAELSRLREERDAARRQSRESSRMYVTANEQLTELLQQQSFMERKVTAQREDIERLATRVEKADAEVERLRSNKDEQDWRTLEIVNARAEAAEQKNEKLSALIVEQEAQYRTERKAAEDERDALREALTAVRDCAEWYGKGERLAHEIHHALVVEVYAVADMALAKDSQ